MLPSRSTTGPHHAPDSRSNHQPAGPEHQEDDAVPAAQHEDHELEEQLLPQRLGGSPAQAQALLGGQEQLVGNESGGVVGLD